MFVDLSHSQSSLQCHRLTVPGPSAGASPEIRLAIVDGLVSVTQQHWSDANAMPASSAMRQSGGESTIRTMHARVVQ
jgi:hypothetical protein